MNASISSVNTAVFKLKITSPTINKHHQSVDPVTYIHDKLTTGRITTSIITREISRLEQTYIKPEDHQLLKHKLKEVKKILEKYFNSSTEKSSKKVLDSKTGTMVTEISEENLFESLNPMITDIYKNIDMHINGIIENIKEKHSDLIFLNRKQQELNENYNTIMHVIKNNDGLVVKDLLIRLHDTLEKITGAKDAINILIKQELISEQLNAFIDDVVIKNATKAEHIQQLVESPINFDAFENDKSLYFKALKNYLLSIDAYTENFDYDSAYENMCKENKEQKLVQQKELQSQNIIKEINILKENILDLTTKLGFAE